MPKCDYKPCSQRRPQDSRPPGWVHVSHDGWPRFLCSYRCLQLWAAGIAYAAGQTDTVEVTRPENEAGEPDLSQGSRQLVGDL